MPVDLVWARTGNEEGEVDSYVKEVQKSLGLIWERVIPHDQKSEEGQNPCEKGDRSLVRKQQMERDHKFSPKWKGPFIVTRIVNRFQLEYDGKGTTHG